MIFLTDWCFIVSVIVFFYLLWSAGLRSRFVFFCCFVDLFLVFFVVFPNSSKSGTNAQNRTPKFGCTDAVDGQPFIFRNVDLSPIRTSWPGATYVSSPIHEIVRCHLLDDPISVFITNKLPRTSLKSLFGKTSLGWCAQIGETDCRQTDFAENVFPGKSPTIMFEHPIETFCRSAVPEDFPKQLIEQTGLSS